MAWRVARQVRETGPGGHILLITGWRGVGKTTLCQHMLAAARQAGWQVAGLLSPAYLQAGQKVGIEVEDLRNGERRPLARRAQAETRRSAGELGWVFDPEVLEWGNAVLQQALPCDLLVVDELGPLELERRQGWLAGVQALDGGSFRLALAVIRPELLEIARRRWPQAEVVELAFTGQVEALAAELAQRFM